MNMHHSSGKPNCWRLKKPAITSSCVAVSGEFYMKMGTSVNVAENLILTGSICEKQVLIVVVRFLLEGEEAEESSFSNEVLVRCQHLEDDVGKIKYEAGVNHSTSRIAWDFKVDREKELSIAAQQFVEGQKTAFLGWKLYSLAVLGDFILDSKKLLKTCDEVSPMELIDSQSIVFYKPSNNSDLSFSEEDHSSVLQISGDLSLIFVSKIEAGGRSTTYGLVPTWPDGITKGRMKEELKQFEELCEVKYRFGDCVNRVVVFDRVVGFAYYLVIGEGSAYYLVIGEYGCTVNMDDIVKAHSLRDSNMDGYMSRKKTMKVNPTILALEELRKRGGADINDKSVKNLVMLLLEKVLVKRLFKIALLILDSSLIGLAFLVCCISECFIFASPRPSEVVGS